MHLNKLFIAFPALALPWFQGMSCGGQGIAGCGARRTAAPPFVMYPSTMAQVLQNMRLLIKYCRHSHHVTIGDTIKHKNGSKTKAIVDIGAGFTHPQNGASVSDSFFAAPPKPCAQRDAWVQP
jgi:hypothetical protein